MSGSIGKLPILIITLVVGFIMVTTAVLPLAADYSEAKTFTNEGYFFMEKYSTEESITVSWEDSSPGIVNVNGKEYDLSNISVPITILASSNGGVRFEYTSNKYCQFINSAGILTADTNNNVGTIEVVCESGTITATYTPGPGATLTDPVTRTTSYDELYCIAESGDYVMKKSDKNAYLHDDTPIFALGVTRVGNTYVSMCLTGSIENGVTVSQVNSTPAITFTDPVCVYDDINNYKNLNSISKITFTADNSGSSVDVTYSYFIVPAEITADPDNPDTFKNMVRIVPLIALVALVAAAAGMIYFKGKE